MSEKQSSPPASPPGNPPGYQHQEFPKCKYYSAGPDEKEKEPITVQNAEEEKALGPGWGNNANYHRDREAAQEEIRLSLQERYNAAMGNPSEQARILIEYPVLHHDIAVADAWYIEMKTMIPVLQTQAAVDIVTKQPAEVGAVEPAVEIKSDQRPLGFDGLPDRDAPDSISMANLTEKQLDAAMLVWVHELNPPEAARRLDIDRKSLAERLAGAKSKINRAKLRRDAARSRSVVKPGGFQD